MLSHREVLMMRVLLDTDVILDFVLERELFANHATAILEAHARGECNVFISPITPVNVFYIMRKTKGADIARQSVTKMVMGLNVCSVDGTILQAALTPTFSDYEDAVQHTSAAAIQLNAIVTRNVKDYAGATMPVFTPLDFLTQLTAYESD